MKTPLEIGYSDTQLQHILDEALVYMCACPAQVAQQLQALRRLFSYQQNCISEGTLLATVHVCISDAVRKAHAELEQCLHEVLLMEGWNLETLEMPAGLRQLRQQTIEQD